MGHPCSQAAPAKLFDKLLPRERDVLACLALDVGQSIPMGIVCDVSQNCDRTPWCLGKAPCLHKQPKLYLDGAIIPPQGHFKLMGWDNPNIPINLPPLSIRRLTGNMIAVPVMGAVFSAVFSNLAR